MNYADAVKLGGLDDAPPGFNPQPSPVRQVPKKKVAPKKKVEDPILDVDEVKMWNDTDSTEEDVLLADSDSESEDSKPKKTYKKVSAPAETTVQQPKGNQSFKKHKLQVEFQNIKNLVLSTYGDKLAVLNGIAKEMNDELKAEIKNKDRDLHNKIKKVNQPKGEKPAWKGGERNQEDTVKEPGTKSGFKNNNKGGKGKKVAPRTETKKTSKVTVSIRDDDGFILKQVMTSEQAEKVKKGEAAPEIVIPETAVVEEKKKVVTITSTSVVQNNPFGAVLLAGAFESAETELAKKQQKKAQAARSNKGKQKKLGEQQNQQLKKLAEVTSNTTSAKKGGNKNNKKNNQNKPKQQAKTNTAPQKVAVKSQNAPKKGGKKGNQNEPKKKENKNTTQQQKDVLAKKDLQKKSQKEAEEIRRLNEEKKIKSGLRDIEKEKKLRRLAKQRDQKDGEWYESEYVQPAALVGACVVFLSVVYSFVFQA